MTEHALQLGFALPRGRGEVQTQDMEHAQELPRPCAESLVFVAGFHLADDLEDDPPVLAYGFRDEALRLQSMAEVAVARSNARAIQQSGEVLQEVRRPLLRDQHESIIGRRESLRAVEVAPEVLDRGAELLIRRAYPEVAPNVASQSAGTATARAALDQEVICPPAEMSRLEMDLRDGRVRQDRRNPASHE